jgi:dTDP-4-amino-4,6-dideoxygalactose transaminase
MNPNWETLDNLSGERFSVLILVHFFGFPGDIGRAERFCRERGFGLIEDAAHVLLPGPGGIGSVGDLVVYSPRKLLPIPEGGLLVLRDTAAELDTGLQEPTRARGFNHAWVARQMIRRMIEALGISPQAVRESLENNGYAAEDTAEGQRLGCTPYSRGLLGLLEADLAHVVCRRRANYQRLLEGTKSIRNTVPIFPVLPDGVCPYLFPLRMKKGRNRALCELKRSGIPAGIWPALPAEVLADPQHSDARVLRDEIITLPVHQSLTAAHISSLVTALTAVAGSMCDQDN